MLYFYNDLLFEIYHYIPKSHIQLLNKSSKRLQIINGRIERYIYKYILKFELNNNYIPYSIPNDAAIIRRIRIIKFKSIYLKNN